MQNRWHAYKKLDVEKLILILMIFIAQQGFGQNSDNEESGGIYQVAFESLVDDLLPYLKDSIIIISGDGISSFEANASNYQVINEKKKGFIGIKKSKSFPKSIRTS